MEVSKQQEAHMAGTGIAPYVSTEQAVAFIGDLAYEGEDTAVLKSVMPHVAAKAIGMAVAIVGQPTQVGNVAVGREAARWLVQHYVREDFCGLCGRPTDHRGEH